MQYVAEANYLSCCHIVSDLSLAIYCLFFYTEIINSFGEKPYLSLLSYHTV